MSTQPSSLPETQEASFDQLYSLLSPQETFNQDSWTPNSGPSPEAPYIEDASSLVAKTIFLRVRFGSIGNSRKVTGSDVLETDADLSLLKVSKTLLESPELEAIRRADGKMRSYLYNSCLLPDMGILLLPIGMVEAVQARLTAYKAQRELLVNDFVAVYPTLVETSKARLGSLHNVNDYPSVDAIRAKFGFDWNYISFGVPGQLKSISHTLFEVEKEKAAKQMEGAAEEITALMRQALFEMVQKLQDKLTPGDDGKVSRLRETAVTNLQEFLDTFSMRNVTNDKELEAQVKKAKALLTGATASAMRNSELFRDKIRNGMQGITETLGTLVEAKPVRKIRKED